MQLLIKWYESGDSVNLYDKKRNGCTSIINNYLAFLCCLRSKPIYAVRYFDVQFKTNAEKCLINYHRNPFLDTLYLASSLSTRNI